jgi:hypothetical protein
LNPSEYATVCPPRPSDASEGASATDIELATIAQEQADACYRREQLSSQQHVDFQTVDKDLTGTLKTSLEGEPTVKIGNWTESPPPSSAVTVSSFGTKAETELDGNTKAIEVPILLVLGALLGALVMLIWRREFSAK